MFVHSVNSDADNYKEHHLIGYDTMCFYKSLPTSWRIEVKEYDELTSLCCLLGIFFNPEDEGRTIPQTDGTFIPDEERNSRK
jgi:hypothetical protein